MSQTTLDFIDPAEDIMTTSQAYIDEIASRVPSSPGDGVARRAGVARVAAEAGHRFLEE